MLLLLLLLALDLRFGLSGGSSGKLVQSGQVGFVFVCLSVSIVVGKRRLELKWSLLLVAILGGGNARLAI